MPIELPTLQKLLYRYQYCQVDRVSISDAGTSKAYYDPSINSNLTAITPFSHTTVEYRNFSVSWRYRLPNVFNSGLSFYNFVTNNNGDFLSFKIELCEITTSDAKMCFQNFKGAQVLYLTMNVIIVIKEDEFIEFLSYSKYSYTQATTSPSLM